MRVFLSHSSRDSEKVEQIVAALVYAGHTVTNTSAGHQTSKDTFEFLKSEIDKADVVLLAISEHSRNSLWAQKEISFIAMKDFQKNKKPIIPLLLSKDAPPGYLASYLSIDMSSDFQLGLVTLINGVNGLAKKNAGKKSSQKPISTISSQAQDTLDIHISKLRDALHAGRLTLVSGAGISVGAGIPVWNDLLLKLLKSMIERLSNNHDIDFGHNAAEEFNKRHGASSLILGKYLKNNLGEDFTGELRDALYSENPTTCDLIDAIADLSRPQREGRPLDSIVTFNFDALIEENLSEKNVQNRAIYSEAIKHDPNKLPIYHVHGYLPRNGGVPKETDIVFSEDAYHSQFMDPFSWSNLIQLNKLTQNVCLLVGISLTDPNLRRLLDVSWRKNPDKKIAHYAIKKLPSFGAKDDLLNDLAKLLEEQDANALGINLIWVNEYHEVPKILRMIRGVAVQSER